MLQLQRLELRENLKFLLGRKHWSLGLRMLDGPGACICCDRSANDKG